MGKVFVVYVISKACSVLQREFALVVRKLRPSVSIHPSLRSLLTIEFVKVAGIATVIHHTNPIKKSFPRPLTRLLTNRPSSSATYKLIIVLNTKKTVWLIINRNSLLFHPGITIFSNRNRFLKNSLFSSTFFRLVASPSLTPVALFLRSSACRTAAAFCSAIALRMRFMRATKRVRYTARDMRVRFSR